jgi:fucose 4-O-acetylase-like acetyltransferase
MASSHEILASPQEIPAEPGRRERWADNLRVLVIAVVVVWHTATAYLAGADWYYMDRSTSKVWSTALVPAWIISGYALGPLFLVAGWFSARSLAHRGAGAFARARLLRLGVPLLVFVFLINPLASYLGGLGRGGHAGLARDLGGGQGAGPMWFVAALLAFSLAYAMLRRVHAPPVARRLSGDQVMVAAALLIAVTAFVTWRWWPPDDASTFWHLQWESWPQGAGLFALGVWAGETGSLEDLTARARRLGWTALAAVVLLVALAGYEQARGQGESTLHGAGWAAMLGTVLYGIISVAFAVWFTVLIRARWSGGGPVRACAGRASYATYFLHPLVLTAIMVLFASLALAPELKFLAVAVVAVPVCFLAGYAATRVPGMSKALLLTFPGALDDHLGQPARQPALAGQGPPALRQ